MVRVGRIAPARAPPGNATATETATARFASVFMPPAYQTARSIWGKSPRFGRPSGGPGRKIARDATARDQPRPQPGGPRSAALAPRVGVAQPVEHLLAPGDVAAGAPQEVVQDLDRGGIGDLVRLERGPLVHVDQVRLQHV